MYVWVFRHLPGPWWVRTLISLALLSGALGVLVGFVFPWFADVTHLTEATVGQN